MKKVNKEWFIEAPWGKIFLVSWGNPSGPPVLLVHGRQDSSITFTPLLELLPDKYNYVGADLPGHGYSDPFPLGLMLQRFHYVSAIEVIVSNLGWTKFVYMAHSMGTEMGLYYNIIKPGQITKFILLDPKPSLNRLHIADPKELYQAYYHKYYTNYNFYNVNDKIYTKEKALQAVMKARAMTAEQAEVILTRNLENVGPDQYKLTWDKRLRSPTPNNFSLEYYCELFSRRIPPTLFISALNGESGYLKGAAVTEKLINELIQRNKHFYHKEVSGNHDVHFIHPERMADVIKEFLEQDFGNCNAKL